MTPSGSIQSSSAPVSESTPHGTIARRVAEGKSSRDATRILKRYLARHLYRVMQNATPLTT